MEVPVRKMACGFAHDRLGGVLSEVSPILSSMMLELRDSKQICVDCSHDPEISDVSFYSIDI